MGFYLANKDTKIFASFLLFRWIAEMTLARQKTLKFSRVREERVKFCSMGLMVLMSFSQFIEDSRNHTAISAAVFLLSQIGYHG